MAPSNRGWKGKPTMSAFDFAMLRRTVCVPLLMTFAFTSAQAQELPAPS